MQKLLITIIVILVGGTSFYLLKPLVIKNEQNIPTGNFTWPITYSVDITRVTVDQKTREKTSIPDAPNFRYIVDGLKVKNVPFDASIDPTIFRFDKKVYYSINGATKVYTVHPLTTSTISNPFDSRGNQPIDSWVFQRKDVSNGKECDLYLVTPIKNTDKIPQSFYVCMDKKLNIPAYRTREYTEYKNGVQTSYPDGRMDIYSNYTTVPVPVSEFEPPFGYVDFNSIPSAY